MYRHEIPGGQYSNLRPQARALGLESKFEQMKENYLRAESIRMFQNIVNGGMTDSYLRWAGIEATKELAASNNSKFVIMGGRDGLPVILNMDSDSKGGKTASKKDLVSAMYDADADVLVARFSKGS